MHIYTVVIISHGSLELRVELRYCLALGVRPGAGLVASSECRPTVAAQLQRPCVCEHWLWLESDMSLCTLSVEALDRQA